MSKNKLHHILEILHRNFVEGNISYALIGAMALSAYGLYHFEIDGHSEQPGSIKPG